MENNELGSKKMNNKQESTSINDPSDATSTMQSEFETDQSGVEKVVNRARHTEQNIPSPELLSTKELGSKPSDAPEAAGKKMLENTKVFKMQDLHHSELI